MHSSKHEHEIKTIKKAKCIDACFSQDLVEKANLIISTLDL